MSDQRNPRMWFLDNESTTLGDGSEEWRAYSEMPPLGTALFIPVIEKSAYDDEMPIERPPIKVCLETAARVLGWRLLVAMIFFYIGKVILGRKVEIITEVDQ